MVIQHFADSRCHRNDAVALQTAVHVRIDARPGCVRLSALWPTAANSLSMHPDSVALVRHRPPWTGLADHSGDLHSPICSTGKGLAAQPSSPIISFLLTLKHLALLNAHGKLAQHHALALPVLLPCPTPDVRTCCKHPGSSAMPQQMMMTMHWPGLSTALTIRHQGIHGYPCCKRTSASLKLLKR